MTPGGVVSSIFLGLNAFLFCFHLAPSPNARYASSPKPSLTSSSRAPATDTSASTSLGPFYINRVFIIQFLNQSLKYDLISLSIPKSRPSSLLTIVTCDYTPYASSRPLWKAVDDAGSIKIQEALSAN
ncbi:hypothetical protein C8J57DRAFT_1493372 [Mycena rebaudengoi]|nr:hypothetical protein C8J57DRAFT_1493372 [Mycena rebaudengoi]